MIKLVNNEEFIYKDLAIKSIKCTDSKFDDNPEVKAYIQVRDLTKKDRNNVFVFNGWMFSSSPSIAPLIILFMIFGLLAVTKVFYLYLTN